MTLPSPAEGMKKHLARPRRSLIGSLGVALLIFLAFILLAEGLFRATSLDRALPLRSLGVYHAQFEIKWFELKDYVRQHGGVDVILLGNSMVNTGIDPVVLAEEYRSSTGEELRIFNFGVEGLTVAPNSVIAEILVRQYHPGTLVFVTEMRDYAAKNGLDVEETLLSDEWFAFQTGGDCSLPAWFKANSTLLQHLLPWRNWTRPDFLDNTLMSIRRYGDTTPQGYEPDFNTGVDIDIPPDPNDPEERDDFALFADFSIAPTRQESLGNLLSLQQQGVNIIVTEMPVHPAYFTYFGGEQAHHEYLKTLVPFINASGATFLPALPWQLIPLDHRVDHHHLNHKGAALFSKLLAQELAVLCRESSVCLQPASGGTR